MNLPGDTSGALWRGIKEKFWPWKLLVFAVACFLAALAIGAWA